MFCPIVICYLYNIFLKLTVWWTAWSSISVSGEVILKKLLEIFTCISRWEKQITNQKIDPWVGGFFWWSHPPSKWKWPSWYMALVLFLPSVKPFSGTQFSGTDSQTWESVLESSEVFDKMHTAGPIPDLLNPNIWGKGAGMCRVGSPSVEPGAAHSEHQNWKPQSTEFWLVGMMACSALSLPTPPVSSTDYHHGIPHPSITSCPIFQNIPHTFKPSWHSLCLEGSLRPSSSILGIWGPSCSHILSPFSLLGRSAHYLPDPASELCSWNTSPWWKGEEKLLLGNSLFPLSKRT